MYPILIKYWCTMGILRFVAPAVYFLPFGFVLLPICLLALNKEVYLSLKRLQLQKTEFASKTVTSRILNRWGWYADNFHAISSEDFIFGDLTFQIASLLETLYLLPEIITPVYDGIESVLQINNVASSRQTATVDDLTGKSVTSNILERTFYQDYDMMEDVLTELRFTSGIAR